MSVLMHCIQNNTQFIHIVNGTLCKIVHGAPKHMWKKQTFLIIIFIELNTLLNKVTSANKLQLTFFPQQ